jgi:prevent-host-death family protein
MTTMNLHEAQANLSQLVDAAAAGEEIIIAKAGKPMVRLIPVESRTPRQPGIATGRVTAAFFELLPEQELSVWEV